MGELFAVLFVLGFIRFIFEYFIPNVIYGITDAITAISKWRRKRRYDKWLKESAEKRQTP